MSILSFLLASFVARNRLSTTATRVYSLYLELVIGLVSVGIFELFKLKELESSPRHLARLSSTLC